MFVQVMRDVPIKIYCLEDIKKIAFPIPLDSPLVVRNGQYHVSLMSSSKFSFLFPAEVNFHCSQIILSYSRILKGTQMRILNLRRSLAFQFLFSAPYLFRSYIDLAENQPLFPQPHFGLSSQQR
jgi:hypothetical protein